MPAKANPLSYFFTEDRIVFIVILLNAIVLCILSFKISPELHFALEAADVIFVLYFLFEAVFKIRQYGWRAYISLKWNQFDFIILILSFPSILALFEGPLGGDGIS